MRIPWVILLSLVTNAVLAMVWFHLDRVVQRHPGEISAMTGSVVVPVAPQPAMASDDGGSGATAQTSWSDLKTDDLKEFVRRLRAAGCPEETIKDLVLAKINRSHSANIRAIQQDDSQPNDYWKPYKIHFDPAEAKKSRQRAYQFRDLFKAKTALIIELFGVDVEKERRKEEGIDDSGWGWNFNGNLAYLPESKRDAVQKYLDDFQDKEQEFYASTQGGWDADARARQKQLEQDKLAALAQILTPQELREYQLRNSQIANQISFDLHGVDISREQYEALFEIHGKYGDSINNWSDADNDADTIKQIEQNKKDMQAEIASALGTDKAQELERAQDYNYQQLNSLANHYDLPSGTATKVYDFKSAAETAVKDLQANKDLTPEQRQAALAQIHTETESAVKTAFGNDKIYKHYMNNGGWWLNNLAPSPSKK